MGGNALIGRRAFALGLPAMAGFASLPRMGRAAGVPSGTLTVALGAESTTFDPTASSAGVDWYFIGNLFEQLVRPDPSGKTINWLAKSWEVTGTQDKPIIDVTIRDSVLFHNGDPLTASDFEFAWQLMRDPKHARFSHMQADVESFEIVDDHRFRLHFSQPDASYLVNYLQLWAVPKKYYQQVGADGFVKAPIGTGPWKFVSRTVHEDLRLEAFDGYWNKDQRPGVQSLVIKIIPEDLTRVAAFKTGAVDWIDAVPPAMVAEFRKLPGVSTKTMADGNNLFINFDSDQPNSPFKDVRVRQAAAHAIDIDAIVAKVLFGQGERYVEVAPGEAGYDPALKPYAYDPKKARELLRAAGHPNGFDVPAYNLTTPREPNVKEMGEAAFAYLSQAGIRCRVQELEYGAWINEGRRKPTGPQMDGAISWMWSQGLPGDPGTAWEGHLHSYVPNGGYGSYSYTNDPEVDKLLEQQRRTLDPAKRDEILRTIARIKHERVLGGLTTYRPLVTFAWRMDKVAWTPWSWPGYWRSFQEIGRKA